jgi:hypothetical protein
VGCDETLGPSRELRPVVALVPADGAEAVRRFPWLGYLGHWGEAHRSIYDGPTGPNTNRKWQAPITWARASWRDTSFAVPSGRSLGRSATDFFCGAVAAGSNVLTAFVGDPSRVLFVLAALSALIIWLASRTRWNESSPFRVARRRPWGSLVASALRLYRAEPALFLGIGLLFVPLGVAIAAIQYVIFELGSLHPLVESAGASNAVVAALALALGSVATILGLVLVQAATAAAVCELDAGSAVSARAAYRMVLRRLRPLIGRTVVAVVVVTLLGLTGVGLVLAVWLAIRWSLVAQAVMLDDGASSHALRRSAALVREHWWRAASITLFITGFGILLGPAIGVLLLFVTSASFDVVNLVAALVYVVAMPLVAITTTYLYFDLAVRRQLAADVPAEGDVLPAEL